MVQAEAKPVEKAPEEPSAEVKAAQAAAASTAHSLLVADKVTPDVPQDAVELPAAAPIISFSQRISTLYSNEEKAKQYKAQAAQKEALKLMAAQGMAVEQPKHMSYEEKLA